jgi:hypothetical protein
LGVRTDRGRGNLKNARRERERERERERIREENLNDVSEKSLDNDMWKR